MELQKNVIRISAVALAIIVLLVGGIWYVKTDIEKRADAITRMRSDMRNRETSLASLARLQSDAGKASRYLPQLEQLRTTREQLLEFSTDIGFLAKQAGFSGAPKFKEAATAPTGDLQKTSFSLTLEGKKELSDLGLFFESVEKSSYFVHFEPINVLQEGDTLRVTTEGYVISF